MNWRLNHLHTLYTYNVRLKQLAKGNWLAMMSTITFIWQNTVMTAHMCTCDCNLVCDHLLAWTEEQIIHIHKNGQSDTETHTKRMLHTHTHMYTHTQTHTHSHTQTHTHTSTHTIMHHAHTHMHVPAADGLVLVCAAPSWWVAGVAAVKSNGRSLTYIACYNCWTHGQAGATFTHTATEL